MSEYEWGLTLIAIFIVVMIIGFPLLIALALIDISGTIISGTAKGKIDE